MASKAPFVDAMHSQPELLALAHSTIIRDLDAATLASVGPGETVGVVAMGASSFSGDTSSSGSLVFISSYVR